jgi:hypothetical protein
MHDTATRAVHARGGFERVGGWAAIATAVAGAGYAVSFVALKHAGLSALFLMLAPLLSTFALVALYGRLRAADPLLAIWVLGLGIASAIGASVHGAYDLANVLHPPSSMPDLPNPIDPRGFLTFGLAGAALLGASGLIARTPELPTWVAPAAILLGVVLVLTWLGRLIVLDATSPFVLGPALVAGLLSPAFYLGLGIWFLRGRAPGLLAEEDAPNRYE